MELRQLRYVVAVAETRHISRAAEQLHIAQPSLSQQIAKLERELGVPLFSRHTSGVELTDAGARFVERARRILDLVADLQREMADVAELKKGRLVIGSLPVTGAHVLPRVLPAFRARYPGIEVQLVEETTAQLIERTARGHVDLALLTLPLDPEVLAWEVLGEEEILLAIPPDHPLCRQGKVPIGSLADEAFIFLKEGQGFRQIALELCRRAGFEPRIVFESSHIETVQSLVAAGMGVAFVPRMVARSGWEAFPPAYVHLAERPHRTLVLAWRKAGYRSRAAETFVRLSRALWGGEGHAAGDPGNGTAGGGT